MEPVALRPAGGAGRPAALPGGTGPGVRLEVFGALRVVTPYRTLTAQDFPGAKPRQVLQALLCQRGHRVSKSRLAGLLWGEQLPRDHAATLETYVSVLRRTLDPHSPARDSVIVTEAGGYRIGPAGIEVDLDGFDALVQQAAGASPPAALDALQQALRLVRGEVLEEEGDADWAAPLRQTYRDRHVQVLVDAGRLSLMTGDAPGALSLAQQAVALDPLSEPPYQVLMTAAYSLGRQAEALAAFERCRRLLADELGADPLDQTVALHLAILRHESIAELLPGDRAVRRGPTGVLVAPSEPPLLGREAELASLTAAAGRARSGRFVVALVTGSAGMGKSRLVEEWLASSGLPSAVNRCSDLESCFPYLALALAVQGAPVAAEPGLPGVDRLLGQPDSAASFDQPARLALMEAFGRGLRGAPPFVLWLDDAQWADPDTVATLGYLQRRCADVPVLVVLTCDRTRASMDLVRRLRPDLRVDLDLLPQRSVEALGHDGLWAETAGHPLFVEGWLRARRNGLAQPFPHEICERVLMQCWDAGPRAYRLLGLAAALEEATFTPELLAALAEVPLSDIADDLDRLFELGLLSSAGQSMRFRTPALQAVLCAALSPASRAVTRARASRQPARPQELQAAAAGPAA